jgi:hypothetical protein
MYVVLLSAGHIIKVNNSAEPVIHAFVEKWNNSGINIVY